MPATVVRYRTKPDRADENQAFVEKVYAELQASNPDGLRYMTFRLADGVTFVHVAMTADDGPNPLTTNAAFAAFQEAIADRCEEQPVAMAATVVGAYRFPTTVDEER
jgi:hypothetical protein